ncbi:Hexose transporter 2 [Wickerhamomyces ciferrii]|uniref:Hexose transporter 2 n=1 Tax=Wickerhamomyces ciferrii (strain ATCC 14091 / BCRC 22168 / CBS 111 / JCM 3599 / NBRC 0793 / NRRL Y-1031 F-60-10) TaxID=1206466 RepID=K0KKQ7_WICCF|nr:Hexose transporter 2 [Wickerhamomyces ciferrii]CCH41703.1 Hexose transporter 2 [Wickerhamomyces ciferrii]
MTERLDVISDSSSQRNGSPSTSTIKNEHQEHQEHEHQDRYVKSPLQNELTNIDSYQASIPSSSHHEDVSSDEVQKLNEKNNEETLIKSLSTESTSSTIVNDDDDNQSIWDLKKAILLCIITSFSGFIFGWDVGTIGGITNMESFKNKFGNVENNGVREFSSIIIGLIISIFNIGCAIGGLSLSKIGDSYGRKIGLFFSIFIYIIGLIILITSTKSGSWLQIFFGRIITGLAVGSTSVLTPMFISENAPLKIRGAMVVLYQLMITLGILMGNIVNFICKRSYQGQLNNDSEWMIPIGLCFVWSAFIVVGISAMPESPIYLINIKNDVDQARLSIAKLNNTHVDDPKVSKQVESIVLNHERTKREVGDVQWNEFLIGKPKLLLRLVIGMVIMFCQQFSGANYFFYYGTTLFNSVGIEDSYITSIILGGVNFISTFGGIYFVERFGRKACLLVGSIGMGLCMAIYSSLGSFVLNSNANGEPNFAVGIVMILFTCVYIFFFATTWGPVSFVVVSELFPVRVRNTSMSISTSINWISNFLISLFTPYVVVKIGFKLGYVFVVSLIFSGIFVLWMVPETKGLNIEDFDELYQNGSRRRTKEGIQQEQEESTSNV